MAERPRYVKRRAASPRAGRLAALAGVAVAAISLVAVAWGFVAARGGEEREVEPQVAAPAPKKPVLRVVFPEGFTRRQMAQRITAVKKIAKNKRKIATKLDAQAYLRLTKRGETPKAFRGAKVPHLEGFLFPATYEFTADTTTRALVRKQLAAFANAWEELDLGYARSKNLTPYDVLIIGSMVEEEVQVPKERPLVAAVIYNRLRVGLPLGIDATIRYGLGIAPTEPIHQSELASDSPYNTRRFSGLPPTPISNPGLASLRAAARPANVDFLYFVRKPDCKSHFFTADEDEFFSYTRAGLNC